MEKTIISQLVEAAGALGVGAALGIVYDFLRCVRREFPGALLRLLCDAAFALLAAFSLFAYGIASPSGGLTLYIALLAAAGAALYFAAAGRLIRRIFSPFFGVLRKIRGYSSKIFGKARPGIKKIKEKLKNIFSRVKKWFTITGKAVNCENPDEAGKGRQREVQENRLSYESSYRGPDYLRCD